MPDPAPVSGNAPPTGTITFLFTDIEGSTRRWEQHRAAMSEALVRHDRLLRQAIEDQGGHVFKTVGDAFCAAFPTAPAAFAAALQAQQILNAESWGDAGPIRVRMALHTGTAEERDNDYFGPTLNRVARLLSIGHGGQILLSQAAAQLVRDTLPDGVSLRDLGTHKLRDLQHPEQVFQALHPDLPADFRPLCSQDTFPNNLPQQLTSFIGRQREIEEVKRLLTTTRLLTLTGAGGCGKTRLALEVAVGLLEAYPDGVWLVELAALSDPALVPQAVASVLGVAEEPGRSLTQTLAETLKAKSLLLVLDNCEHLVAACATLAAALLRAGPNLRILATSREPLGVAGETPWRVPSLGLPDPQRLPPIETLTDCEAVRLFHERATTILPTFALTHQNAPSVAQVCRRLDGIPLAIELAAARVRALPVEQIARRLDDRFRLLTGGSRTGLAHHQTLQAAMDWSYDLLTEAERSLLRRLAVFAGGWSLEAAEAVCSDDFELPGSASLDPTHSPPNLGSAPPQPPNLGGRSTGQGSLGSHHNWRAEGASILIESRQVLDLLTSLVDKSLVLYEEQSGTARYRLLETVRQYGQERLRASSEFEPLRTRHQQFFLQLAEEAEPNLRGPDQKVWYDSLETEHENLREAWAWDREETQGAEASLRIASALWRFWYMRGYLSEGRERLAAQGTGEGLSAAVRARALHAAGTLAVAQGDYAAAQPLLEESVQLREELGDKAGQAQSLMNLGAIARYRGDLETARTRMEESLALRRDIGDRHGIADALVWLGTIAYDQGDFVEANAKLEEGLTVYRALGSKANIGTALSHLGAVADKQQDYKRARALYEESLAISRELGDKSGIAATLNNLGNTTYKQGEFAVAQRHLCESLTIKQALGDKAGIASTLETLAYVAIAAGKAGFGARLLGAAKTLRAAIDSPLPPSEQEEYDRIVETACSTLRAENFDLEHAAGRAMTLDQAIAAALEHRIP